MTGGGGAAPFFPLRTISPSVASTSVFLLTRVPRASGGASGGSYSALSSGSVLEVACSTARASIFGLSGTGSVGATVGMYIEQYQPPDDAAALEAETADALAPLVDLGALALAGA